MQDGSAQAVIGIADRNVYRQHVGTPTRSLVQATEPQMLVCISTGTQKSAA